MYLTKKRIVEQLEWSNACYRDAIYRHFGHILPIEADACSIGKVKLMVMESLEVDSFDFPDVTTTYLNNLRQLETDQLELIVEAYHKGKQWRSASTIDVLLSELFERATQKQKRKK